MSGGGPASAVVSTVPGPGKIAETISTAPVCAFWKYSRSPNPKLTYAAPGNTLRKRVSPPVMSAVGTEISVCQSWSIT